MQPLLINFEAAELKRLRELSEAGTVPMAAIVRRAVRAHLDQVEAFTRAMSIACTTDPNFYPGLTPVEKYVACIRMGLREQP